MGQNLVQGRALRRVAMQNSSDQTLGLITNLHMLREAVRIHSNPAVRCFNIACLKRRFADEKGIHNHAKGPYVHLIAMSLFPIQHFWGNVVRCAADCPLSLAVELELRG
jgi:hypothetical protein